MDNTLIIGAAVGVVVFGGLIWWYFGSSSDDLTPKSKDDIKRMLEAQGYKIKDIDFDDGEYEAEVYKDGKEFEIKLDRMGKILKIKGDD